MVRNRPPSLPDIGLVLLENPMEIVGSSILTMGRGSGFSAEASVEPTFTFSNPAMVMMSPAIAVSDSTRLSPLVA